MTAASHPAVESGGLILEAEDVADVLLVLDGITGLVDARPEDAIWAAYDRLRALLVGEGAG